MAEAKILYILGRGRSGSTIFANVMGAHEGFASVGEVRYLWDPIVSSGGDCACGQPIAACPLWSQVFDLVGPVDIDEVVGWQHEVLKERNLFRILRYRRDGSWPALDGFLGVMSRVYDAIARVTGARVIVDSSKRPSYAAVVRLLSGPELYCVHLLRDPRASAYSWGTSRHRSPFGGEEIRRRNAFDSTLRWNVLNVEAEVLLRRLPRDRRMRLRYERFVDNPRASAAEVAGFVGEGTATAPFAGDDRIVLGENHTVAGNPSRFSVGEVTIRDKGDWWTQQKTLDRSVATVVALPFLHAYGYTVRGPSHRADR